MSRVQIWYAAMITYSRSSTCHEFDSKPYNTRHEHGNNILPCQAFGNITSIFSDILFLGDSITNEVLRVINLSCEHLFYNLLLHEL